MSRVVTRIVTRTDDCARRLVAQGRGPWERRPDMRSGFGHYLGRYLSHNAGDDPSSITRLVSRSLSLSSRTLFISSLSLSLSISLSLSLSLSMYLYLFLSLSAAQARGAGDDVQAAEAALAWAARSGGAAAACTAAHNALIKVAAKEAGGGAHARARAPPCMEIVMYVSCVYVSYVCVCIIYDTCMP